MHEIMRLYWTTKMHTVVGILSLTQNGITLLGHNRNILASALDPNLRAKEFFTLPFADIAHIIVDISFLEKESRFL